MGIDISDPSRIDSKVYEIFSRAECDSSGCLRRDQFAVVCRTDRRIRKLLAANGKANSESWRDVQWWTYSSQRKRWSNGRTSFHHVLASSFLLRLLLPWHLWSIFLPLLIECTYSITSPVDQEISRVELFIRWSMMTDSLSSLRLMCSSIHVDLNYHRVTGRH